DDRAAIRPGRLRARARDHRRHCARLRGRDGGDRHPGERRREGAGSGAGGVSALAEPFLASHVVRQRRWRGRKAPSPGTATIKSVTPDVRAPSRSWSLVFLGTAKQHTPGRKSQLLSRTDLDYPFIPNEMARACARAMRQHAKRCWTDQKSIPPPGGMAGAGLCFFGSSATIASVVIRRPRPEAASGRAVRTALCGSMMPFDTRLTYSPVWASKP